jgi:hypothetical protein
MDGMNPRMKTELDRLENLYPGKFKYTNYFIDE